MNRIALIAAVAVSTSTLAQVRVEVQIPLPTITFQAPPPLIVVQPGIQVVEDYDEEIFFVDNYYWVRRDDHWFRSRDHRGNWVVVERNVVPVTVARLPPGQYKHWKRGVERREERREDRREDRREEKQHGNGNGNGKHGKH